MIPVLFEGTATTYTNNGLGRLADAITCKVTEERNGIYELEMTYPITGIHYDDIQENRIILAKTEEGGNNQAFMIYRVTKPLNGIVTVNAQHISYVLNGIPVMPFTATSLAEVFTKIPTNAVIPCPFTFTTSISSAVNFSFDKVRSIRSLLGGESGSILDVYGGYDYKFDNFNVQLLADRGNDNGVTIRYGKNLTELKSIVNSTSVYTGIVPFWKSEDETVYLTPDPVVLSAHYNEYPYKIIRAVDFSNDFEEAPTQTQLRNKAESHIARNQGWRLKNNITVSFVALAQTEEYKNMALLERVRMCDTVTVRYDALGVDIKTRVIKTVYNVLTEKYDSLELGEATYSLAKALQESIIEESDAVNASFVNAAIKKATQLIQGGLGGHVVFNTNADGEPEELLIMDTDDISTAVNVIRLNLNGIGFSSNGYNGPFTTAWTIDGAFVANFITSGTLNANVIKAGIIADTQNNNYWNLETGAFKLSAATQVGNSTIASASDVSSAISTAEGYADSALSTWITNTYNPDKQTIEGQIDGKAETWYQSSDPASVWTTAADKAKHKGDLWYNTNNDTTWYYQYDSGTQTYSWVQQNVPTAVFDQIDGKAQIFLTTPVPPYNVGDLWCQGTSGGILTCVTAKTASQSYAAADWEKKNNYTSQTDIDSSINTYDTALNQQKVFNKLTNNGALPGIYMDNGQLYINGTYIKSGVIDADLITSGSLEDSQHTSSWNLLTGVLALKGAFKCGNPSSGSYSELSGGKLDFKYNGTLKGYVKSENIDVGVCYYDSDTDSYIITTETTPLLSVKGQNIVKIGVDENGAISLGETYISLVDDSNMGASINLVTPSVIKLEAGQIAMDDSTDVYVGSDQGVTTTVTISGHTLKIKNGIIVQAT